MSNDFKQELKEHAEAKRLQWMFTDYSGDIFFAEHKNPGELDYFLGLGIAIHVDTNGVHLTQAMIERVMTSAIDAVSISVDAATDRTYHAIRIGSPSVGCLCL